MLSRRRLVVLLGLFVLCITSSVAGSSSSAKQEPEQTAEEAKEKIWHLITDPPENMTSITEKIPYTINMTLVYNGTEEVPFEGVNNALFVVSVSMTNQQTLNLTSDRFEFTWEDVTEGNNKTLELMGRVVGYVDLNFKLEIIPEGLAGASVVSEEDPELRTGYLITVVRQSNTMANIMTMAMAATCALSTISMGCALDLAIIKKCITKPIGPIVGFISQFTFMPLFSLAMGLLLIEDPLKGFGLLVIGICPGGLASNFWTLLLDGDVNLSITMTFISSIAAMGMMPFWLWLLAGFFLPPDSDVQVPFLDMTVSLILLTAPLGIGLLIRRFKVTWADFLEKKILKPFSFVLLVGMFSLAIYTLWDLFQLLDIYMLMAGLSVSVAGFIFGAGMAWIARRTKPEIIAISLETAMQNANVAFVLLQMSLPTPYSDMASLTPIAQILMTTGILFVLYAIHLTVKCCKAKCCKTEKTKPSIPDGDEEEGATEKDLMMKQYASGKKK